MATFERLGEKKIDDSTVILYRNVQDHAWFVGKTGDPALDPFPLGAFVSKEAAQRWADHHFPGGEWKWHERGERYHPPYPRK
jgi:hypothetical protein